MVHPWLAVHVTFQAQSLSCSATTVLAASNHPSDNIIVCCAGPPSSPAALTARLPGASSKRKAGANASAEQFAESLPWPSITHVRRVRTSPTPTLCVLRGILHTISFIFAALFSIIC